MFGRTIQVGVVATLAAAALLVMLVMSGAGAAERAARPELASFQTHLSTDKPLYRAGEKVYIRGVVLHADTQRPVGSDQQPHGVIRITGPRGETVHQSYAQLEDSVLGTAWPVPEGQAGGRYTLTAEVAGYPPATRTFDVRAYRAPRLRTQIQFLREGYGPGDTVVATVEATRAEGGIPQGAEVTVIARLDGAEVHQSTTAIDARGRATARFTLPDTIERGDGTLAFAINDAGTVETATRTLPILLQTVDLGIYPEGGDLVAGVPNRVYIEARTPAQRPADIAGVVMDGEGETVAHFKTTHEGRGRFEFVPKAGEAYAMRIEQPAGIEREFDLPAVKAEGTVIRSQREAYDALEPIVLGVFMPAEFNHAQRRITLSRRDRQVAATAVNVDELIGWPIKLGEAPAGEPAAFWGTVSLTPPDDVHGVLVATVWDADGKPVAERLIYRQPRHQLNVSIAADRSRYVPGESVELSVQTRDERGNPVPGVVGLTVTDDSVLEMIQTREQAPRLPVMVLIEPEVRELADAHVYLDPDNANAPEQLDLLLGTQGWRRFATVDVDAFVDEHDDAARRALALVGQDVLVLHRNGAWRDRDGDARVVGRWRGRPMAAAAEQVEEAEDDRADAVAPIDGPQPDDEAARPAGQPQELRENLEPLREPANAEAEVLGDRAWGQRSDRRRVALSQQIAIVREYAHQARPDRQIGDRRDFTETVYWHAGIRTDESGQATVAFDLSDSVTSFRIFADGFDGRGALGAASETFEAVEPFYVSPSLPQEVTAGDEILLPVAVVNNDVDAFATARLYVAAPDGVRVSEIEPFTLDAGQRLRQVIAMNVGERAAAGDLVVTGEAGLHRDRVTRRLNVVPRGFPVERAGSGIVSPDAPLTYMLRIPDTFVPGSIETRVAVYPSPVGNLTDAVAGLIRQPSGCFEQTSSTTYPMVMAIEYLQADPHASASTIKQAHAMLESGYQRLIGFETDTGGFEWFGKSPGHVGLTAYGLLQFTDMARIREVDADMLKRTRQWLLDQRDGQGSFGNEARTLHSWSPDPEVTDAYVVWALLRAGQDADTIEREIDAAKAKALASDNSYVRALGAMIARATGDDATARRLSDSLVGQLDGDTGFVSGATTTVTRSGGQAMHIETAALSVMGWLGEQGGDRVEPVERAMRAIAESAQGGRYGSTQSTVLALSAIIEYNTARAAARHGGELELRVDGERIDNPASFTSDAAGVIDLADFADRLGPGEHAIEVRMAHGSPMPAGVTVRYRDEVPDTSDQCALSLAVALGETQLTEGGVTEARVTVTNTRDEAVAMPLAIVGIPAGLEVRHDQLAELVDAERIAAYEVRGRDLVLYWRGFEAGEKVSLPVDLIAAIPGRYTGPASRAYLYYTDEHRTWLPGLAVTIRPQD